MEYGIWRYPRLDWSREEQEDIPSVRDVTLPWFMTNKSLKRIMDYGSAWAWAWGALVEEERSR
jgi:hypothetical protein